MSYAPIRIEPTTLTKTENDSIDNSIETSSSILSKHSRMRKSGNGTYAKRTQNPRANYSIVVHCHLCWDWVWQRPQQFLSRLSQKHPVLFVETVGPAASLAAPIASFRTAENFPNVTILRLQFPDWMWPQGAMVDDERYRTVKTFLRQGPLAGVFENPVQWFYDPMAVTSFAGRMGELLTVYDCMDELAQFRGAPPEIHEREKTLLSKADLVFTGGRKLYESKSRYNDNCHFYGCGVDLGHFGSARAEDTTVPETLAALPKPVLGYFGVIDERMDYDLLDFLAAARPDWTIAMVGPVMKVDPNSLPKRANIYWAGKQAYKDLPAFCKGFDICLMPFALNEATEFINPTKALEYMATGRLVISTAVPDVVSNFSSAVKIGRNYEHFLSLCEQALGSPDVGAISRGLAMAGKNSWDSIVNSLDNHVREALAVRALAGGNI